MYQGLGGTAPAIVAIQFYVSNVGSNEDMQLHTTDSTFNRFQHIHERFIYVKFNPYKR